MYEINRPVFTVRLSVPVQLIACAWHCDQALTCLAETPEGRKKLQDHVDKVWRSSIAVVYARSLSTQPDQTIDWKYSAAGRISVQ